MANLLDYFESVTGKAFDMSDVSLGDVAAVGGTMYLNNKLGLSDGILSGTKKPPVGYQGKIEDLTKVRERVAQPDAPTAGRNVGIMSGEDNMAGDMYQKGEERRPGGKGRRYFTDSIYAKKPKTDIPTIEEAEAQAKAQAVELAEENKNFAAGGLASMDNGYYLGGKTDGMADDVPARIDGNQEARLSDGEFVIPADVVSHLGNGNSDAGADQLHSMMSGVRQARTGNPEQGKQINPQQFMPKMAQGGLAQYAGGGSVYKNKPFKNKFPDGDAVVGEDMPADQTQGPGTVLGENESLANWAGDYVTGYLAKGQAEAETPYEAYDGPLTAGTSTLQNQAFTGILDLNNPLSGDSVTQDMGGFTPDTFSQEQVDTYMNPYTDTVIDRTAADMRRQSQVDALGDRSAMTRAGAFGGSRDALLRAERSNNLSRNIGDMSAEQRAAGYNKAMDQFNTQQDRMKSAQEQRNKYGFDVLETQAAAGQVQRDVASEGIAADYEQFREERDYDKKMVQYLSSLVQGLPIEASQTVYSEPSELQNYIDTIGGLEALLSALGLSESESPELNYDINNDGVEDAYDVGPAQPV